MHVPLAQLTVSVNTDGRPKSGKYHPSQKLSKAMTAGAWSPIVFRDSIRLQTHFLYSDWAVLDFDSGRTIGEAINQYQDCIHIIGTTKSHTEDHHKFRVCIPWERRITDLNCFRYNQKFLIDDNESDQQCRDGARLYYPCRQIVSVSAEGYRMEVREAPKEAAKTFTHSDTGFSTAVNFYMRNVIFNENVKEKKRNVHVYQVSKDLFRIGLSDNCVEELILKSPTYRDTIISDSLLNEIRSTMKSAWRSVNNAASN